MNFLRRWWLRLREWLWPTKALPVPKYLTLEQECALVEEMVRRGKLTEREVILWDFDPNSAGAQAINERVQAFFESEEWQVLPYDVSPERRLDENKVVSGEPIVGQCIHGYVFGTHHAKPRTVPLQGSKAKQQQLGRLRIEAGLQQAEAEAKAKDGFDGFGMANAEDLDYLKRRLKVKGD